MFKGRTLRKEWVGFEEVYRLLDAFKMSKADFIKICCISPNSFYLWQRKGKIPASTLYAVKFAIVKCLESKHQESMRFLFSEE